MNYIYLSAHFKKAELDIKERVAEEENLKSDVLNQDDIDTILQLHQEGEKTRSRKEFIVQHLKISIKHIWDIVNVSIILLRSSKTSGQKSFLN